MGAVSHDRVVFIATPGKTATLGQDVSSAHKKHVCSPIRKHRQCAGDLVIETNNPGIAARSVRERGTKVANPIGVKADCPSSGFLEPMAA
ncbi:hypothetical protein KMP13_20080 [Epibacterium ulvae]|nr:hypothetical protein [Epibacterium ulvae]